MKKRLLAGLFLAALLLLPCASCGYDEEAASYQLPADTLELTLMWEGWDMPDGMCWRLEEADTQRFAELVNLFIPHLDVSPFPYENGDTLYSVLFNSYKDPVTGARHGYTFDINENYVRIATHCYHTDELLLEIVELYFSYSEVEEW
ncbi:MAG TPA: hypothetical protein IAA56_04245 [Candidatus Galloscillospira excrementavium]|nr:hypothetical protein [Candidatus Galloscillospira excrementavium]